MVPTERTQPGRSERPQVARPAIACVTVALLLAGCEAPDKIAPGTPVEGASGVLVERIFVADGCVGYRFVDDYYTRYFVRCSNATVTTTGRLHSGKTTRPDEITTQDGDN